jgi:hypothetical protein
VICDEFLKGQNHYEHPNSQMSDAEVMTTAIVAMIYFGGNYSQARELLGQDRYIPTMLGKSRFSRRLNRLDYLIVPLFYIVGQHWKSSNEAQIYNIDTFPIRVCDNWRIPRCRLYTKEVYRGYIASKRQYFYGLKIHLMVTATGEPVEFFLTPGSCSDVAYLDQFDFDLPEGATVYADKIYNDYEVEDLLKDDGQIDFLPIRKSNSKRKLEPWIEFLQRRYRKMVETSGSLIERLLPKHIHATNAKGFELKVILFVLAFSFSRLFKLAT